MKAILKDRNDRVVRGDRDRTDDEAATGSSEDRLRVQEREKFAQIVKGISVPEGSNPSGLFELCGKPHSDSHGNNSNGHS